MTTIAKQRVSKLSYFRSVLRGSERDEARFLGWLESYFGSGIHCIPVGRARTGIYLLVKNAIRGRRIKVVLSPYTIPDVVNMVVLAGGTPVFVDFEPRSTNVDLDQLSDLLSDDVACVLITHYHVNQVALPAIISLCRERGILLFEDCAITFGGSDAGRPLGTHTDGSVFSFSIYKVLNFFWGGLITTRDDALAQSIRAETSGWERLRHVDYIASSRHSLVYDIATRPIVFNAVTFPMLQRRAIKSSKSVELTYPRIEHRSLDRTLASRPAFSAFAEWRSKADDVQHHCAHRRRIASVYAETFGDIMVSSRTAAHVWSGSCFVNFPVFVKSEARDEAHRQAMIKGYDIGKSLYPNVHDLDAFKECEGYSRNARELANSSVYFPTHFGTSPAYARRLSTELSSVLR